MRGEGKIKKKKKARKKKIKGGVVLRPTLIHRTVWSLPWDILGRDSRHLSSSFQIPTFSPAPNPPLVPAMSSAEVKPRAQLFVALGCGSGDFGFAKHRSDSPILQVFKLKWPK